MGLTPLFTQQTIIADLQRFAAEQESKFIEALAFIGEEFVNAARSIRTYENRTSNLRSSIGYSVVKNGSAVSFNLKGDNKEGENEGKTFAETKIAEGPQTGIYLLVFAGMEYALYVEANNYDVLTGSRPSRQKVLKDLKDLLL